LASSHRDLALESLAKSTRPEEFIDQNRTESMKAGGATGGNSAGAASATNSLARGKA
jgi:hypothetical protein